MRLGLASIFAWRPHMEHLMFLAHILKKDGHELFYLTCDSAVSNCYNLEFKGHGRMRECPTCILGGVRSYSVKNVQGMSRNKQGNLDTAILNTLGESSAYTVMRTETADDLKDAEVQNIIKSFNRPIDTAYQNAVDWIEEHDLEGVIAFNGRMDLTRAITLACESKNLPYLTLERTPAHGMQLIPNANCLSRAEANRLMLQVRDKALTKEQAMLAAQAGAERHLKQNKLEWRVYNLDSVRVEWPGAREDTKVLILPSSKNEFEGHEDWHTEWSDYTIPMDELLKRLQIRHEQVVLRCHPNWAERIGRTETAQSEEHYTRWGQARGFTVIGSSEKADTQYLIEQADLLVVNGSSAAIDAGMAGKKIVCLGHAGYESAGYVVLITSGSDWQKLAELDSHDPRRIIRQTLRGLYFGLRRFVQYTDYVQAKEVLKFEYFEGADPNIVINMLKTGKIELADNEFAKDGSEEDEVVRAVMDQDWGTIAAWELPTKERPPLRIKRRWGLRWIDPLRSSLPRGDR